MLSNKKITNQLSKIKFIDKKRKIEWKKIVVISFIFLSFFAIFFFSLIHSGISINFDPSKWLETGSLKRVLASLFVGFGLSVAGCGMQGVTRNDLSSPTTLGLLPASTLGIIVCEILFLQELLYIYIFGIMFALIVLTINFATLKIKAYKTDNYKSVLIGLIVGVMITSLSLILKAFYPRVSENVVIWLGSNSSHNYTWERLTYSLPAITIGSFLILIYQKKLNIIESDISLATSLGINIKSCYWVIGVGCALISISSALLFGSVIILGIIIPHLARMMLKTRDYRYIMPISGFMSATTLLLSSTLDTIYPLNISLYSLLIFIPFFIVLFIMKKVRK